MSCRGEGGGLVLVFGFSWNNYGEAKLTEVVRGRGRMKGWWAERRSNPSLSILLFKRRGRGEGEMRGGHDGLFFWWSDILLPLAERRGIIRIIRALLHQGDNWDVFNPSFFLSLGLTVFFNLSIYFQVKCLVFHFVNNAKVLSYFKKDFI